MSVNFVDRGRKRYNKTRTIQNHLKPHNKSKPIALKNKNKNKTVVPKVHWQEANEQMLAC